MGYILGAKAASNYFPLMYIIIILFDLFIKEKMVTYAITLIATCIFVIFCYFILFKKENKFILITMILVTFLSYPFMFEVDRANLEYVVWASLILFFIFYKKQNYKTAAVMLAFPICMKLYPAVFILLFLQKKRIKEFCICGIVCIIVTSLGYVLLGGTFATLPIAISGFESFIDTQVETVNGVKFDHTIWSMINYYKLLFGGELCGTLGLILYTVFIIAIAILIGLYIIFLEKEEWKIITLLTVMMITFPYFSYDYTLIHMFIPIGFFITSKDTKKWEDIVYAILFGITIMPMNWFEHTYKDTTLNAGSLIRPLALIAIMLTIILTKMSKIHTEIIPNEKKKGLINGRIRFYEETN